MVSAQENPERVKAQGVLDAAKTSKVQHIVASFMGQMKATFTLSRDHAQTKPISRSWIHLHFENEYYPNCLI